MEQKSVWKNFLLLTVGGLLALHINVSHAQDKSSGSVKGSPTSSTPSDDCILEAE